MKQIIILAIIVLLGMVACIQAEDAYFAFRTHRSTLDFVFKLTDVKKIEHARKLLSDNDLQEVHVMGRIRKTQKDYNPHYSYHLEPDTITFFSMAIEVVSSVHGHLN
ncbi:hypothetical protein DFA_03900 [Cavenderia fasciculata]|uniref:BP74 N-terminal domain-containing protein n=1 Tax=Cavenderia fasciculata TaxID=261658 RepID=F4Q0Q5_CACFS|nr:uncharacterized protein DFA_03900 [Cavenderia fasciculata]EGG18406.1 hypothetical protein DFA_03900 [Cavenderia fasciculata]|eukprot:XP_004366310.1 hypothetical protein DFA_03900 [Cavenderia fasciculata]